KPAEKIVLVCNTSKNFSDEFILYLNNRFDGYPVTKGEQFLLNFLGTSLEFKVQTTVPKEVVRITKSTRIIIKVGSERSYDSGHHVTYEQIGGLKTQISRLREI